MGLYVEFHFDVNYNTCILSKVSFMRFIKVQIYISILNFDANYRSFINAHNV